MNALVQPIAHIEAIDRPLLNDLLGRWGHRMGPYVRPRFAVEAHHALFEHGLPIAVIAAGETVREVVGQTGVRRAECIELVRLCAGRPHLCRPMLRLWRELVLPDLLRAHARWLAVSYQDEALHSGDVYRFDGWREIGRSKGGGVDRRSGRAGRALRIWAWSPDEVGLARLTARRPA